MITLTIRYTIDLRQIAAFEAYVNALPTFIERAGGRIVGYFMPTSFAGPTNAVLGLIEFESLAAYEAYRARLAADPEAVANVRRANEAGCIVCEDRAIMQRIAG